MGKLNMKKIKIINRATGKEVDRPKTDMGIRIPFNVIGIRSDDDCFICDNGWEYKIDHTRYEIRTEG